MLSVIDLDGELALNGVVKKDTSLYVHLIVLVVPVSLERDGNTVPTVGVNVTETITTNLDDALGEHMRLLVQVDVVLPGVVKSTHGTNRGELLQTHLRHLLENIHHHYSNFIIN